MTSRARTPAKPTKTSKPATSRGTGKPPKAKPAKKQAAKKQATKKTAGSKKTAAKKTAAKKQATKKTAAKKQATKKSATKKASLKKPAANKLSARKGPFLDLGALAGASAAHITAAFEAAPWDSFDPPRDLPALRDLLRDLESREGVGAAHRRASAGLRPHARLVHGLVHNVAVSAIALSHDGRYLATGSWCGDDYERGGVLQIWEVEAGRCVNVLDRIPGGVGWPDYARQIQWSPDDTRVGAGFNTNVVGVFEPFGADIEPVSALDVTQGWSRPPSWCWSPDGQAIAIACWKWGTPPKIPVVIARPLRRRVDDDDVAGMKPAIPDDLDAELNDDTPLQPMTDPLWCADGVIRGHNTHGQVFAVDTATGAIVWHGKAHAPLIFSPDGRYFADSPAGLAIYDGLTGLPTTMLPMIVGARDYVWAPGSGSPRRLAMIVEADNDFDASPGTHILDDGELLVSLDDVPRASRWDEPDFRGLAFSRDGQRLLILDEEGRLAAFALAQGAARRLWECALEGVSGVLWAAGDVVIAVGAELVVFLDGATGDTRARHVLRPEPTETSPLELDGTDLGARMVPSPLLAVDSDGDRRWALVFPDGPLVCPDDARAQLDDLVTLAVARRFAWPLRWTEVPVYPDLAAAARDPSTPLPKAVRARLTRSPRAAEPKAEAWPPATGGTFGDLLAAHCGWLGELSQGWAYHVAEQRTYVARIHARLGEAAAARACVVAIDDHGYLLAAAAAIAVELAAVGAIDSARELAALACREAVPVLADGLDTCMAPASLAAALAVLGDPAADARFAEAEANLFPETNAFEHVGHLATLLAGLGRDDHALAVILKGPWDGRDIRENYFVGALAAMTARGRFDLIERFFDHYFAQDPWSADKVLDATVGVLLARGDFARALAWLPRFERCSTDALERRAIHGLWDSNQRTDAWARVEPGLPSITWLPFAAAIDPARVAAEVEARLARAMRDDLRPGHLIALAEAATRTGAGARALALPFTAAVDRLALATGVLQAGPSPALRDAAVALATEPLTQIRADDRAHLIDLGVAAHRAGATDLASAAFARARSFAVGREVRWVVSEIVRAASEVGALGEAHAALLRMPRSARVHESRPLITGCALHGEFAAAIRLLEHLPNANLNDRGNISLAAIAAAARARLPGLGEPY